ncbi:hypothetical protein D3C87_2149720 [compost metagenome]
MRHPLNLPAGSVRAILALLLVSAVAVPVAIGRSVPESAIGLAGVVLGFYFRLREEGPHA